VIALLEANCTACMICARECPDWCIHLSSHTETVQVPGARPRTQTVLDRFAIDYGQCLYCGICVDVCPFDALHWAPEHDYPGVSPDGTGAQRQLVHERDRLASWLPAVPPPPPTDQPSGAP
jgi:NADH-quinone oxidoreductase subunit I